jgi:hypothetical protein
LLAQFHPASHLACRQLKRLGGQQLLKGILEQVRGASFYLVTFMTVLLSIILAFALQQQPDHSDKHCIVVEIWQEGRSSLAWDCGEWTLAKGEKLIMPPAMNKQLRLGDTFDFVWKETQWVAEFKQTVAVTLPNQPASVILRTDAEAQFKQLCKVGSDDVRLRALAAALNPMPDYPQMVMNNEPSVCNRNPKPLPIVSVGTTWP